jgi:zinc resistance-associated protein
MRTILVGTLVAMLLMPAPTGATADTEEAEQAWVEMLGETDWLLTQAAPGGPGGPGGPGWGLRRWLNLTDEQARRVEQILAAHRTRTERLRIDLGRARLDAREIMLQATPDRSRLEAIARRMGELQGQLIAARFNVLLELKTVLTPEQWTRLRAMPWRRGMMGRDRFR